MLSRVFLYSIIFIFSLISFSRANIYRMKEDGAEKSKEYIFLCSFFSLGCIFSIITASVSTSSNVLMHIFYYISEFFRIFTLTCTILVVAFLTDYIKEKPKQIYNTVIVFLYIGVSLELINLFFSRENIYKNIQTVYYFTEYNFLILLHTLYDFSLVFVLFLLIVRYYEKCKKPREIFGFKLYFSSVLILFAGFFIENMHYILLRMNNFAVIFAMAVIIVKFGYDLNYKNSIEYTREDYSAFLAPTYEKSVIILNDEGTIIFANKRAQVFAEGYRDIFEGRNICGVFSISDDDRERLLSSPSINILLRCVYKKSEVPVLLHCEKRLDRYKNVFSSIVTIEANVTENDNENLKSSAPDPQNVVNINLTANDITELRTDELLNVIEKAKFLYQNEKRELFCVNLKSITKLSDILGYSALNELSNRIKTECDLHPEDLSTIDSMMIEIDRQCESIKALR